MSDVEQIELSIEEAKKMVDLRDSIMRLSSNRDFKKVFLNGYFKDEAVRLTHLTADPQVPAEYRDDVILALKSISICKQYLSDRTRMGDTAEAEIIHNEEVLAEVRAEEDA